MFCELQEEDKVRHDVGDGEGSAAQCSPQKDEEDEGDEMVMPDFEAAESLNRGTDKTTEVIDATLKDVSPRYKCCETVIFLIQPDNTS